MHPLKRMFICAIAAGLILPFLIVAGVSINANSNISFPPSELSLRWYTVLFTESDWLIPIRNSLLIAVVAATISVSIALAANYVLWRLKSGFGKFVFALASALSCSRRLSSQWGPACSGQKSACMAASRRRSSRMACSL